MFSRTRSTAVRENSALIARFRELAVLVAFVAHPREFVKTKPRRDGRFPRIPQYGGGQDRG